MGVQRQRQLYPKWSRVASSLKSDINTTVIQTTQSVTRSHKLSYRSQSTIFADWALSIMKSRQMIGQGQGLDSSSRQLASRGLSSKVQRDKGSFSFVMCRRGKGISCSCKHWVRGLGWKDRRHSKLTSLKSRRQPKPSSNLNFQTRLPVNCPSFRSCGKVLNFLIFMDSSSVRYWTVFSRGRWEAP